MASLSSAVAELTKVFAGRLIEPGAPILRDVRRVHNGAIDKRPALVARCRGAADIADAIRLARAEGLEIAVRGGGHNVAGRGCVEGGVMIDLSLMRHVTSIRTARVAWAGGGALWREFNRETQQFGLATTGGVVSSTGVAGLTLGGGFGWLMPRFGMALDNLRVGRRSCSPTASVVRAERDRASRSVLGGARRRRKLRRRRDARVPAARSRPDRHRRARRASRVRAPRTCCDSSASRRTICRTKRSSWRRCSPRRTDPARRSPASPRSIRVRSPPAKRSRAAQGLRPAGHGRDGPDAVCREQHDARRRRSRRARATTGSRTSCTS